MLKIYGVPISVHTRKVILFAIEKRIRYEIEPVIPFNPPAGWGELSPTGKIPVATHDGLTLRDSSVICTYLERTHPQPALYPQSTGDLVQALWFEEYADGTVFREVVQGLFVQKVIRPNILKQPTDPAAIVAIENEALPKVFSFLEASIDGEFLAGGTLSVADLAVASNLVNFHYLGYAVHRERYPKLAAYFNRLLHNAALQTALRNEQPFARSMGLDCEFLSSLNLAA